MIRSSGSGVSRALMAAALFGASTPVAKILVGRMPPLMLAGLLYLGSGAGLTIVKLLRKAPAEAPITWKDAPWLGGAVFFGGMLGPALLMFGLQSTSASNASLLLNLEGVFTALLAWFVFREHFDARIAAGMALIVCGGVVLSWDGTGGPALPFGALTIAGACLCWGLDNNLTQKVSAGDPVQVAAIKGVVAGSVNLFVALSGGARVTSIFEALGPLVVGFLGYGMSLVLFVLALRTIGTARTGAYFSTAPFVGAALSLIVLRDAVGWQFVATAVLMGIGVWLHITERHEHEHTHEKMTHIHRHVHDEHHQHTHGPDDPPGEPHTHAHVHDPLTHSHPHYPDIHHRHGHG